MSWFIGNSSYRICGEHDLMKHSESSQSETQARKVFVYFCRVLHKRGATPAKSPSVLPNASPIISSVAVKTAKPQKCPRSSRSDSHLRVTDLATTNGKYVNG